MIPRPRLLGAVLTGGEGRRFGGRKAGADLAGIPMGRRVLRALKPVTALHGFVVAAEDPLPHDVPARRDRGEGRGPLEGLAVALHWAGDEGCEGAVVLACDLPLMDPETVRWLVRCYRDRPPDAVHGLVPEVEGRLQPLAAVYSVRALPLIEERLEGADRSLFGALGTLQVQKRGLDPGGPPAERFLNVNTAADHERATAVLREGREGRGGTT